LHAECEFERVDPGFEAGVLAELIEVLSVELSEEVEFESLELSGVSCVLEVGTRASAEGRLALPMGVPWKGAGRNALPQFLTPP
jgi:hypothetical protein